LYKFQIILNIYIKFEIIFFTINDINILFYFNTKTIILAYIAIIIAISIFFIINVTLITL